MTQSSTEFFPLNERENQLAKTAVDIAFDLYKALGAGLLESVYENYFCYEFKQRNIPFLQQPLTPIFYKDFLVEDGKRLNILVDDLLIIELKAQENNHPTLEAQFLSYLRRTGKRLGYVINFHVLLMKSGFKRFIL